MKSERVRVAELSHVVNDLREVMKPQRNRSADISLLVYDLSMMTSPTPEDLKRQGHMRDLECLALQASWSCLTPLESPLESEETPVLKRRAGLRKAHSLLDVVEDRPGAALQRMSLLSCSTHHQKKQEKSLAYQENEDDSSSDDDF